MLHKEVTSHFILSWLTAKICLCGPGEGGWDYPGDLVFRTRVNAFYEYHIMVPVA